MRLKHALAASSAACALALAAGGAHAQSLLNWAQGSGSGAQAVSVYDNSGALVATGATINETTHTYTPPATNLASNVTGNLGVANLAGGVGAGATTFFRGDASWASVDLSTADVTGNLGVSHLGGGTGASSSTFLRGDMTWATPSSTAPGGSATQCQFNSAGSAFGGIAGCTWDGTTLTLTSPTLAGTVTLPGGGTLAPTLDTFAQNVTSTLAAGGRCPFSWASGGSLGGVYAVSSSLFALGSSSTSASSCGQPIFEWTQAANSAAILGTAKFEDNTGAATVAIAQYVGGATPTFTVGGAGATNNGELVITGGGSFSGGGAGIIDCGGSATYQTTNCQLNLATLTASTAIRLPDTNTVGWGLNTTFNRLSAPLEMTPFGNAIQSAPTLSSNALTVMTLGDPTFASVEITGTPKYNATVGSGWTSWGLCLNATDGFEVACTESGADGENHFLTIGFNRFSAGGNGSTIPNGVAGVVFNDFIVNSTQVSDLTGGLGGSGITSAPTVSFSGGCNAQASAAINNGAVVGYSVYNPGTNGLCNGATVTLGGGGASPTLPTPPTVVNGSTSNQAAPYQLFDWDGGPDFGAFGPNSSTLNDTMPFRFGSSSNFGSPGVWDNRPANQENYGFTGGLGFGHGTGTTSSDGAMNWDMMLKDDNAGHLALTTVVSGSGVGNFTLGLKQGFVQLVPVTVAGLATADPSPADGDRATVTDATSCTFQGAITGGGSTKCPVVRLGGAWLGG